MIDQKTAEKIYLSMESEYRAAQQSMDVEISKYMAPMRGAFNLSENKKRFVDGKTILNSYALTSVEKCAAGFMSYMSDQTKTWFVCQPMNKAYDDSDAAQWLADLTADIRLILAESNVYAELINLYKEFNLFSRGVFIVARDYEDVVRAYSFTAGSYYLGRDKRGAVTKFAVKQRKSVGQLVEEFGYDQMPYSIKQAYDNKQFNTYRNYMWIIIPNSDYEATKDDPRSRRWLSLKWLESEHQDKFIEQSGFDYFPVVVATAHPIDSSQIYGGEYPGAIALPEVKELQAMQKDLNMINAFNANPTWVSHGVSDHTQIVPGGVITFEAGMAAAGGGNIGLTPAMPFRDPKYLIEAIREKELKIDSMFFVDLFQLLKTLGPNRMTAYEVNRRYSEMVEAVGPVVMQLQKALSHMLEIVLNIVMNTMVTVEGELMTLAEARIGRVPSALQGQEVKFKFVGILSILQRATEMLPMEQLVQFLTYLRSSTQGDSGDDPMDWLDVDDVVKKYALNLGANEHLKGADKVRELRETREQAMMEQQQRQDYTSAIQATQALAQTPIGKQTALGAITGGQPV
jgi:hypothetical protein